MIQVARDADQNPVLEVLVELLPKQAGSEPLASDVSTSIRRELLRLNGEFRCYTPADRQTPRVRLLPHAHPEYFPAGVKHRYTRQ